MQVIDGAIALTKKVYAGDEAAVHHYDYDWLLDPVVKVRALLFIQWSGLSGDQLKMYFRNMTIRPIPMGVAIFSFNFVNDCIDLFSYFTIEQNLPLLGCPSLELSTYPFISRATMNVSKCW